MVYITIHKALENITKIQKELHPMFNRTLQYAADDNNESAALKYLSNFSENESIPSMISLTSNHCKFKLWLLSRGYITAKNTSSTTLRMKLTNKKHKLGIDSTASVPCICMGSSKKYKRRLITLDEINRSYLLQYTDFAKQEDSVLLHVERYIDMTTGEVTTLYYNVLFWLASRGLIEYVSGTYGNKMKWKLSCRLDHLRMLCAMKLKPNVAFYPVWN